MPAPLVGIVMGSANDWDVMQQAAKRLTEFGVPWEARVISAHRSPQLADEYASTAAERGLGSEVAAARSAAGIGGGGV